MSDFERQIITELPSFVFGYYVFSRAQISRPVHRAIAHSFVEIGPELVRILREEACHVTAQRRGKRRSNSRIDDGILYGIAAGFINGVAAGLKSQLLLYARTQRYLPSA